MTNKAVLLKGIRYLAFALPLLFIGPVFLNSCFKNESHPLFPYLLILREENTFIKNEQLSSLI
jgi:hypothetical protein